MAECLLAVWRAAQGHYPTTLHIEFIALFATLWIVAEIRESRA